MDKLFADCNSGCVSVPCYGVVCGNTIPFLLMIAVLTCGRKISHILETVVHMQVRMPKTDNILGWGLRGNEMEEPCFFMRKRKNIWGGA